MVFSTLTLGVYLGRFLKKSSLDPEVLRNYRPVSNLSFISKILEKIVAKRLRKHLEENDLYDPLQSAYRSGHSTETALIKVQDDLLRMMDKNSASILVLLDLSAAFDTVDHEILLSRLQGLGVQDIPLSWFRSYLTGRWQHVKIHEAVSAKSLLSCGVPQGSVLGPLLFLVYMSPLRHVIAAHGMSMHGYADDTQLYLTFSSARDPEALKRDCQRVETCISEVHRWMTTNRLKLNPDKTEVMLVGPPRLLAHINIPLISVAGVEVAVSKKPVRNLGVEFDPSLSMVSQVTSIVKSANFHLRNVGRVRQKLTDNSTKSLIQSLVISRLDYCNGLLSGITDELCSRIQIVQNNAARVITRTNRRQHITPILHDLHWLPVRQRVEYKVLLLVYKSLHGLAPQYICDLLSAYQPTRTLRSSSSGRLVEPRTRLKTVGDRAFSTYAPRSWNKLDNNIKNATSFRCFKKQLKTYLFKEYFNC